MAAEQFIRFFRAYLVLFAFIINSCSSTSLLSQESAVDTGTADNTTTEPLALPPTIAKLSDRIESVTSALIPTSYLSDTSTSVSEVVYLTGLSGGLYLDYASASAWEEYIELEENYNVITTIFGPAEGSNIRAVLDQWIGIDLRDLMASDPNLECTGGATLDEGDTLEVAFYGTLANGTADDRFYECVRHSESANDFGTTDAETNIYGLDANNVFRATMMFNFYEPTDDIYGRGNVREMTMVLLVTYAEAEAESGTAAFLDMQLNSVGVYIGSDGEWYSADDIYLRNRARITGRAVIDSDESVSPGFSDFVISLHSKETATPESTLTASAGRGGYGDGDYSLFRIDSSYSSTEGDQTFCLQHSDEDTFPAPVDPSNCLDFESSFAWEGEDFPFDLDPELQQEFSAVVLFAADNNDLINPVQDGGAEDNFTIPTYTEGE